MNPSQIEWTDEKVAELRELVKTLTASQIAMKWDVTRNVISGKMDRLGIKRPDVPIKRPQIERRGGLSHTRMKPAPNHPWRPMVVHVPRQAPTEPARERCANPVDIWGLTWKSCRYPLWNGDEPISEKLYCGDAAIEGVPYCLCHAKITFTTQHDRLLQRA